MKCAGLLNIPVLAGSIRDGSVIDEAKRATVVWLQERGVQRALLGDSPPTSPCLPLAAAHGGWRRANTQQEHNAEAIASKVDLNT
jgi:hypothetical protein